MIPRLAYCSSAKENGCHGVPNSSMKSWNTKTTECEPGILSWNIQHTYNKHGELSKLDCPTQLLSQLHIFSYQTSNVHDTHHEVHVVIFSVSGLLPAAHFVGAVSSTCLRFQVPPLQSLQIYPKICQSKGKRSAKCKYIQNIQRLELLI